MIDPEFGHIPGVVPDRDLFSHIGGQRGIDIAQGLEPQPILMHAAGLRDRQQQQIQLIQGHGQLREKAIGAPAGLRGDPGGTVGCLVILMEHEVVEGLGEALQSNPGVTGVANPAGAYPGNRASSS